MLFRTRPPEKVEVEPLMFRPLDDARPTAWIPPANVLVAVDVLVMEPVVIRPIDEEAMYALFA